MEGSTGNGSGQGWDERAFSAQVAEWPIAVAAKPEHRWRARLRGVGGERCCGPTGKLKADNYRG